MPYRPRNCEVCTLSFTPPHKSPGMLGFKENYLTHCPSCRRATLDALSGEKVSDSPSPHYLAAPMRQIVFDLETWGLDRGWGVTMVASYIVHGGEGGMTKGTLTLRDYEPWKAGKRSYDRALVEAFLHILGDCHIAYAHNGDRFDVRWLRTVALKYELNMPRIKLVDPCSIAWRKYLLGRNSLEAVADFLGLEGEGGSSAKLHVSPDVWRKALMDDDDAAWALLVQRCESDVEVLNKIASKVTGDVGMIDYGGSWR